MMPALARQELSRTQQAGLLARAALTVAAGRMGGRPPDLVLEGEDALQAEVIEEARRRLSIAPDDGSDDAFRAIEEILDAEMEAVAEPVDFDPALPRAAEIYAIEDMLAEIWGGLRAHGRDAEHRPSLFERVTASFGRQRSDRRGARDASVAEEHLTSEHENAAQSRAEPKE